MKRKIDLNSDLAEGIGPKLSENDLNILSLISSANIACGYHAGTADTMADAAAACKKLRIALGAHPGFQDKENFGRTKMKLSFDEIKNLIVYQIGALSAFAADAGIVMQHVKPHGALYNMAGVDIDIARAIAEGVKACNKAAGAGEGEGLILMGQGGSAMEQAAKEAGIRFACEVFADRAYNDDGTLVSRTLPGAVIHDAGMAAERALRMAEEGTVTSINGKEIKVKADSICVHGDTKEALEMVKAIREKLEKAGFEVSHL